MMYVYKVTCIPTGEFYFGARWTTLPDKKLLFDDDFWKTYFTSSAQVRSRIEKYGLSAFSYECVWEGDDVDVCLQTERDVTLANWGNPLLLNRAIWQFTQESVKRAAVFSRYSLARRSLAAFVFTNRRGIEFARISEVALHLERLDFIESNRNVRYVRARKFLQSIPTYSTDLPRTIVSRDDVEMSVNVGCVKFFQSIGFVNARNQSVVDKVRIGNYKEGKTLMHKDNIERWYPSEDVDKWVAEGWQFGRCPLMREVIRQTSSGRCHTEASKQKMSECARRKVYYTSPCLTKLRAFQPGDEIPAGWIKGNKLKSRNQKISESMYEQHRIEKESGKKRNCRRKTRV
jgi:hypothetical protein